MRPEAREASPAGAVVWTTTTKVGCGRVQCKGNDIIVCNYDPPGNWQGQYKQHVLPASCKK